MTLSSSYYLTVNVPYVHLGHSEAGRIRSIKNQITSSVIETTTFRLVARNIYIGIDLLHFTIF
jgi:hypothetical protein